MANDLKSVLMQQALAGNPDYPAAQTEELFPPYSPPPNTQPHLPSRWQRWATAQRMINGYQNNWLPHPIVTRVSK